MQWIPQQKPFRLVALVGLIGFALGTCTSGRADEAVPTFNGQVKAILSKRCLKCHTGDRPRGDLDVSTFGAVMQGGLSGKAVVAGAPKESPLYTMTAHLEDPKMPPNSPKIPQSEIDTIAKWIEGGLLENTPGTTTTGAATTLPKPSSGVVASGLVAVTPLSRATPVTALAVSPVAPILAFPGLKQVLLYDLSAGQFLGAVAYPEGEVHALRFSRDGTVLVAAGGIGGQSGAVVGFDVGTWKRRFTITDNSDAVLAVDLSADKTHVVFGGPTRIVKIVAVADGAIVHTLRKPTDWVLSVGFSPDGLLVAAGDRFGGLYVWETKSGKEFHVLRGHTKGVTGMAWRADGDAMATSSEDQTVRVWNMHTGQEQSKWDAHSEGVLDLSWHPNGSLATVGRDKLVKFWQPSGKLLVNIGTSDDAVFKVVVSADAKTVISGDWSGEVRIWQVAGDASKKVSVPRKPTATQMTMIPVPTPVPTVSLVSAQPPVAPMTPAVTPLSTSADLVRKQATLKLLEDSAEKLKDEAARNPKNAALSKAYLQLCEAVLAMKTDVIEAESASKSAKQPEKK